MTENQFRRALSGKLIPADLDAMRGILFGAPAPDTVIDDMALAVAQEDGMPDSEREMRRAAAASVGMARKRMLYLPARLASDAWVQERLRKAGGAALVAEFGAAAADPARQPECEAAVLAMAIQEACTGQEAEDAVRDLLRKPGYAPFAAGAAAMIRKFARA